MPDPKPERLQVIARGYAVVAVFLLTFGLLYAAGAVAHRRWNWPELSSLVVLVVAVLAAAPLVIGLVWNRLTKVKIYEVEISLAEVSAAPDLLLPQEIREALRQVVGPSTPDAVIRSIMAALERGHRAGVVEVPVGQGREWWVTRLHLLAGLVADYTAVERLLFVGEYGGRPGVFLGMAEPARVRALLGEAFPYLEAAYRRSRRPPDLAMPAAPDGAETRHDPRAEIAHIVTTYQQKLHELKQPMLQTQLQAGRALDPQSDESVLRSVGTVEWVTPDLVVRLLGEAAAQSVEWDAGPATPLVHFQILERSSPYVALVSNGQLRSVVNRTELASRIALDVIRARLRSDDARGAARRREPT